MFRRRSATGLLLAGLLLSALPGGAFAQSPAAATLEGVDWRLTQVAGSGVPFIDVPAGVDATLRIDGTQASGSGGCNSWFATVKVDGDAIVFDGIGSTMMACEEPRMSFERQYLGFLPQIQTWTITDGALQLMDAGGATLLVFASDATAGVSIEGVAWLGREVLLDGVLTAIPADIGTTLLLQDGQANGTTGCNTYFGGYVLSGTAITFEPMGATEMACPEPRMAIESAWLTALGLTTGWTMDGERLLLLDAAGNELAALEPSAAASIMGEWRLAEVVDGDAIVTIASEATVSFGEDGSLTGSTGCNNLMGDYAVNGTTIKVGPVATTKMACMDAAASQWESTLLAALAQAGQWQITLDGWLQLSDADGNLLVGFVPGPVAGD